MALELHPDLQRSRQAGKLTHAYLFIGNEQQTLAQAQALAAYILCDEGQACGHCPSCRKLARGNHPDLFMVEPQGLSVKIAQIRQIQKYINLLSYEGRAAVVIIKDAQTMQPAAANSLLKSLEEPPAGVYFILLASSAAAILPTIISRCQSLCLGEIENEEEFFSEAREKAVALCALLKGARWPLLVFAGDLHHFKKGAANREFQLAFLRELLVLCRDAAAVCCGAAGCRLSAGDLPVFGNIKGAVAACGLIEEASAGLQANANSLLVLDVLFLHLQQIALSGR